MILTCNECGIGFNFDENLLKKTGSKVRCSKCKNVFTAYPSSSAGQPEKTDFAMEDKQPVAPGTESSQKASNNEGIELKNIDLAEIEGILGMDNEPETGGISTKGSGDELDFDFTTEEDESSEETLALNLSDMENIFKAEDEAAEESKSSQEEDPGFELGLDFDTGKNEGEEALESTLESEKTEELDMSDLDNVLDVEDEAEAKSVSSQEENLDFELDFGSDEEEVVSDSEPVDESEKTEELDPSDFENILEDDKEPEDKSVSIEEDSGLDLDFDIDETSDEGGSDLELEETAELDLSDMDNVLDVEDEAEAKSESSQEENFDLQLDFGLDKEEVVSDSEPVDESEKTEELDLSDFENILEDDEEPEDKSVSTGEDSGLDLDFDIDESSDEGGSDFELEETVELDLSDMDNVLEIEDEESQNTESAADEDLDFELDLDFEDGEEQDDKTPKSTVEEAEMSDELDFELDLDMDADEDTDSPESKLEPELELEDIEELDLSDMEDGTGIEDKQATEDTYDKKTDELDFELDLEMEEDEDTDDDSLAVELGDAEEFDLSDLDSVLDEGDKQAGRDVFSEEPEELELDLDIKDDFADDSDVKTSEIQFESTEKFDLSVIDKMIDTDEKTKTQQAEPEEIELDFEIEGNAQDFLAEDETIEEQAVSHKKEKLDDTFDMGALKDGSDAEDADSFTDFKKAKASAGKKRLSGPMRILLILVLMFGSAYGAHEVLKSMGIKISVTDAIREIPFIGDLLKPDVKDAGNLYINIIEQTVNGKFVDNPKMGTLFVVTGQIKNEYKHARRFINITGKIYKKGRILLKTETVFCGNLLSESELISLNQAAITKRLKNRLGDKRINMKVKKGQVLPFMIVFPNVPNDLEAYSVQVAGSEKS